MKHPFWIVNSSLLGMFIFVLAFLLLSRQSAPKRFPFLPDSDIKLPKKEVPKIDLNKINSNDLFNTFKMPVQELELEKVKSIPLPPQPKPAQIPKPTPPKLLEPLGIEVKGIMVAHNEELNRAIIKDKKTNLAKNYQVGDMIEDAQLIRILNKKIILIRSNGQQETVYSTKKDADIEKLLANEDNWGEMIQKIEPNSYAVDPENFVTRVANLAQLIDMLNLTTVYKQGQSVGTRVGKISDNSLGVALGLQQGDVIDTINGVAATDTTNRYTIYEQVIGKSIGDTVTVNLTRRGTPVTITYTLKELDAVTTPTQIPQQEMHKALIGQKTEEEVKKEKVRILEEKEKFAPTMYELEKQEKQLMLNNAQKNPIPASKQRGILSTSVSKDEQ